MHVTLLSLSLSLVRSLCSCAASIAPHPAASDTPPAGTCHDRGMTQGRRQGSTTCGRHGRHKQHPPTYVPGWPCTEENAQRVTLCTHLPRKQRPPRAPASGSPGGWQAQALPRAPSRLPMAAPSLQSSGRASWAGRRAGDAAPMPPLTSASRTRVRDVQRGEEERGGGEALAWRTAGGGRHLACPARLPMDASRRSNLPASDPQGRRCH